MSEKEFRASLAEVFTCKCGAIARRLDWRVAQFDAHHWLAVCIVGCVSCSWVHVAAAGSSVEAHDEARRFRSHLLRMVGK